LVVHTLAPPTPDATLTAPASGTTIKLRSRKIRVEVVKGPTAGTIAELPGLGARVGSAKDADLVINDPLVSRHHLTLRIEGETIRVIDNQSRNGTQLDGVRILDAFARPDAVLVIGGTSLRLRMLDTSVEVPLSTNERFGNMVGRSVPMRRMFGLLERIAPTDMSVLVEGETGTGKELVAEGLHRQSRRADGPFVVFDCSAVSQNLIESELFGHKKGAFTDARQDRTGRFEEASGGTLFLDEIGELPLELQPKLLRALERREVRRIGDDKVRHVDVRIIAATNRSLSIEVERGRFREDLYHRLAEVVVQVPALRFRPEDIPMLARQIEAKVRETHPEIPALPDDVLQEWRGMSFPGNVRELRNRVRLALHLGPAQQTSSEVQELPKPSNELEVRLDEPLFNGFERLKERYEKAYLQKALEKTGNNVTHAADLAGVGRRYIQRAMERHGLREDR
jgi:DNA-binding NtrC family response regulator